MTTNLSTWLKLINKYRQLYLKIHRCGGDKDLKETYNFKIVIFFATALQLGVTPQVNFLNLDLKKTQKEENSFYSYLWYYTMFGWWESLRKWEPTSCCIGYSPHGHIILKIKNKIVLSWLWSKLELSPAIHGL